MGYKPGRKVTITKPFYIGKYEVTQEQWEKVMGSNPSSWQRLSDSSSRPVEQVSWNNVADFNRRTGLRLPTEAEWEYACRAGTTTAIHSSRPRRNGSNSTIYLYNIAWFGDNANFRTHRVGRKDPNSWGFYDMIGNVNEWCNDWYGSYAEGAATDPTGPTGWNRVLRGGGYAAGWLSCRSSARNGRSSAQTGADLGFRVARTP
jgi:formylglycine-generating enzyme required for sulfatase activity